MQLPVCRPRDFTPHLESLRPPAVGVVEAFRLLSPRPRPLQNKAYGLAAIGPRLGSVTASACVRGTVPCVLIKYNAEFHLLILRPAGSNKGRESAAATNTALAAEGQGMLLALLPYVRVSTDTDKDTDTNTNTHHESSTNGCPA